MSKNKTLTVYQDYISLSAGILFALKIRKIEKSKIDITRAEIKRKQYLKFTRIHLDTSWGFMLHKGSGDRNACANCAPLIRSIFGKVGTFKHLREVIADADEDGKPIVYVEIPNIDLEIIGKRNSMAGRRKNDLVIKRKK